MHSLSVPAEEQQIASAKTDMQTKVNRQAGRRLMYWHIMLDYLLFRTTAQKTQNVYDRHTSNSTGLKTSDPFNLQAYLSTYYNRIASLCLCITALSLVKSGTYRPSVLSNFLPKWTEK
jgi:hypothetical protein